MAGYNNENLLKKILEIKEIVKVGQKKGYTQRWTYNNKIKDVYFISESTYNNYLARNAKRELAEIEERKKLKEIADKARL